MVRGVQDPRHEAPHVLELVGGQVDLRMTGSPGSWPAGARHARLGGVIKPA
jgi:hypothetical protein